MICERSLVLNSPFPLISPIMPGQAGSSVFFLAEGALCVAAFCPNPPAQMLALWNGQLSYGVFVHDEVPFVVIFFREGGVNMNPGINVLSEVEAGRSAYKEFLEGDSKTITLVLVDSLNNSVRATRTLVFRDAAFSLLRMACRSQLKSGSAVDVSASMWETTEMCDASTMMLLSQVHGTVPAEETGTGACGTC